MAQRSFWVVTEKGRVHGIIGSIAWARRYAEGMEGPFTRLKDAAECALAKFPGRPVVEHKTGVQVGVCMGLSDHKTHKLKVVCGAHGIRLFRRWQLEIAA